MISLSIRVVIAYDTVWECSIPPIMNSTRFVSVAWYNAYWYKKANPTPVSQNSFNLSHGVNHHDHPKHLVLGCVVVTRVVSRNRSSVVVDISTSRGGMVTSNQGLVRVVVGG